MAGPEKLTFGLTRVVLPFESQDLRPVGAREHLFIRARGLGYRSSKGTYDNKRNLAYPNNNNAAKVPSENGTAF